MAVTIDIYYDTRKFRTKTKDYPFKLKVYYNDETRYFLTVYGLSEPEQRKLLSPRLGIELQSIKDGLADLQRTAETFAREMRPFSFDDFILPGQSAHRSDKDEASRYHPADEHFDYIPYQKKFPILLEKPDGGTIGQVFLSIIREKLQIGKVTTALSYQQAYASLTRFGGNATFQKVTAKYLHAYGEWMKGLGNSKTTTGIYLRNLRGVFNEADALRIIKKEFCYPFGKKNTGYLVHVTLRRPMKSKRSKRFITISVILLNRG